MHFTKIEEIVAAINTFPVVNNGTYTQYTVPFRKAVCEFMEREGIKANELSKSVRMNTALISKWQSQHSQGLYCIKGAYNVFT